MKFAFCIIFVLALVRLACAYSITWGNIDNNNTVVYTQVIKGVGIINGTWGVTMEVPSAGIYSSYIIGSVSVIDNYKNFSGGIPKLLSGGPGYRYVKLSVMSQLSSGIDSIVEIRNKP